MKEYWQIIRALREDHDLTQAELARVLGTTQQVYSRYENGTNELPLRHLVTLCQFYRVSADELLGLTPPRLEKNVKQKSSALQRNEPPEP